MNMLISLGKRTIKKRGGKLIKRGCLFFVLPVFLFILILILIITTILSSVVGLFAMEREVKAMDPEVVFPVSTFYLYREVDEEFGVPWALLAGIHYVQTFFAESGGGWLSPYRDAFDLPDNIWYTWQTSREEYWRAKYYVEPEPEEGEESEEYIPIPPDRRLLEDIIYTVAMYLKDISYSNDTQVTVKLDGITGEKKKTDEAKFYYWLFHMMYGRPGWPVPDAYGLSYITSPFGYRTDPFTGVTTFHGGVDIAPPEGEPVFAFADGVVIFSGATDPDGYGTLVIIEHSNYQRTDGHVETIRTYYGHSSNLIVQSGMEVVAGQKIAEIGNEGRSTGPHLHFEVRIKPSFFSAWEPVDPMNYLIPPGE